MTVHYAKDGIVVRDARAEDVDALENRLRPEDAMEVAALATVSDGLARSFARSSRCFTIEREGLPVGMFGVVPDSFLGAGACIWLLGAPELAKLKKTFVRLSRVFIARFLATYPQLWNWVDARYLSTRRWLESCGAVFEEQSAAGIVKFSIRRAA